MAEVKRGTRAVNFQPKTPVTYHNKGGRLIVRRIHATEVIRRVKALKKLQFCEFYWVECQVDGTIQWDTAEVFSGDELVGRNNVQPIESVNKAIG